MTARAYGAFRDHLERQSAEIGRICLLHAATDVRMAPGQTSDGAALVRIRCSFGGVSLEGFTASVVDQLQRELAYLLGTRVAIDVEG